MGDFVLVATLLGSAITNNDKLWRTDIAKHVKARWFTSMVSLAWSAEGFSTVYWGAQEIMTGQMHLT